MTKKNLFSDYASIVCYNTYIKEYKMNIVLLEPEIPYNAGNIGRTCVATNSSLHLIRPFGFILDSKLIKRAGLDYWDDLQLHIYDDFSDFLEKASPKQLIMATTKARKSYDELVYDENAYMMFGKESGGIPENILRRYKDTSVRIPMYRDARSLNLSNSVAIILYEALRQNGFSGLKSEGDLHRLEWD